MFEYLIKLNGHSEPPAHMAGRPEPARTPAPRFYRVKFDIPEQHRPHILDWASSNLERMFEIGFEAGTRFIQDPKNRSLFE
jgi:hypothetical protein